MECLRWRSSDDCKDSLVCELDEEGFKRGGVSMGLGNSCLDPLFQHMCNMECRQRHFKRFTKLSLASGLAPSKVTWEPIRKAHSGSTAVLLNCRMNSSKISREHMCTLHFEKHS